MKEYAFQVVESEWGPDKYGRDIKVGAVLGSWTYSFPALNRNELVLLRKEIDRFLETH